MIKLPSKATTSVSASQFNALLDVVEQLVNGTAGKLRVGPGLQMQQGSTDTVLSVSPGMVSDTSFWAKITGSAAAGDRFTYSWEEVEKTGDGYTGWDVPGTGGRSGTNDAYNGDEYDDAVYSAVPTNTVVRMRKVNAVEGMADAEYWFNSNEDVGGTTDAGFWASIGAATAETDRYRYAFTEVELTGSGYGGWTAVSGGTTGTARNGAEEPSPSCRWRPVPANSVVWMRLEDDEYWFNESQNQDCNPSASTSTIEFRTDSTDGDDSWDITAAGDKGDGADVKIMCALWWDDVGGSFKCRTRRLIFDDSGRLVKVYDPSAEITITTGVECYELPT